MNFPTVDQLEAHLNPRIAVPEYQQHIESYATRSRAARERLDGRYDIAYGDTTLETLDVFPAAAGVAPIQVFIHGGYWRALDKSDHTFMAEPFVAAGATTVLLNYQLCPTVTLDTIVQQVRIGIAWVYRNAAELGGDPDRMYVSGHSAGGHLAVMAMHPDWRAATGLPTDAIKGVFAVSGIYDLRPVLRISVNQDVRLDEPMAERNSPTLDPPRGAAPLVLAVGGDETEGWSRQTTDLHEACRAQEIDCELMRVEGTNHFSIGYDIGDADSALSRAMLRQMSLD